MILNRQSRIPLQPTGLARFLASVRRELKLRRREVTVCFVDEREIAQLNRRFRGKPKPTDVLSFPANGTANGTTSSDFAIGQDKRFLGDIVISPQVARRNAKRFGRTLDEELRVLILHGVLHLMGYDHEADHGEMEQLEARLRTRLGLT
jgi:probable rRNA maturation factor